MDSHQKISEYAIIPCPSRGFNPSKHPTIAGWICHHLHIFNRRLLQRPAPQGTKPLSYHSQLMSATVSDMFMIFFWVDDLLIDCIKNIFWKSGEKEWQWYNKKWLPSQMVSQPLRCLRLWLEGQRHIGSRAKVGVNTPHCVGHGSVGSQGVFRLFLVRSARSHIGSHWHLERICSDCFTDVWGFNAWSWATQAALQLCNSRFLLWQSCLDDLSFGHWAAWEATHKVTVFPG